MRGSQRAFFPRILKVASKFFNNNLGTVDFQELNLVDFRKLADAFGNFLQQPKPDPMPFWFSFVRDPLKRHIASMVESGRGAYCYDELSHYDNKFARFVELLFNISRPRLFACDCGLTHAMDQLFFLMWPHSTLDAASFSVVKGATLKRNSTLFPLSFLGHLENLEEDWNVLREEISLRTNGKIRLRALVLDEHRKTDKVHDEYQAWLMEEGNMHVRLRLCEWLFYEYACLGYTIPEFCSAFYAEKTCNGTEPYFSFFSNECDKGPAPINLFLAENRRHQS